MSFIIVVDQTPLKDNSHSLGGKKNRENIQEKPGISPLVLSDFLLEVRREVA